MGIGLACDVKNIFKLRRSLVRATSVSLGVGIWTIFVCRDVSVLWRISPHPPLTLPLFVLRLVFLAMCVLYGVVWCALGSVCGGGERRFLAEISQVLFVLWYPLALLAGIFTLSFVSLCFSVAVFLIAVRRICAYRSFFRLLRVVFLAVMAYFAYVSLGAAPLG